MAPESCIFLSFLAKNFKETVVLLEVFERPPQGIGKSCILLQPWCEPVRGFAFGDLRTPYLCG